MHELKQDYTLVIVTHNMQQAARVAEMTAFFSLEVEGGRQPPRRARRVRLDREDLHLAGRRAHGGLRHRTVRMRDLVPGRARAARGGDPGGGRPRPARAPLGAERAGARRRRARRRGDRLRRRDRPALPRDRDGRAVAARPPDAGRDRPAARARDAPREPPPRADGRLLRHGREADAADGRPRRERRPDPRLAQRHGPARRADDPRRARRLRRPRRRRRRCR